MKKLYALLMASILALPSWGRAETSEPSGTGEQPQTMECMHGGKMHEEGSRKSKSYGDIVLRHIDDLKLSDEQIGKIMRIHQNNQQKIEDIGKRIRESRKSAYELFLKPSSDEAAIRKAAKDHTAAFDELVDTALKSRAAINAVLTPEQLNQLKSFKTEP